MITREEAIRRLDEIAKEIAELKEAFGEKESETPAVDQTQAFLEKCGGWEDTRSAEEIIADIYAARINSDRGVAILNSL